MKKVILLLVAVVALSISVISCGKKEHNHAEHTSSAEVYTCPMHPEVISDKPGTCPKCGMDLVKKETIKNKTQPDSTMKGDSSLKM